MHGTDGDAPLAEVAAAFADPARSRICLALMDGRSRPAGELAGLAGVSASTASAHLGRLLSADLIRVERRGRHRYYRLAGAQVAEAVESLARLAPTPQVRSLRGARVARDLRLARTCYDHLAGRLGVAVTDRCRAAGWLHGASLEPTVAGAAAFTRLGIDLAELRSRRRPMTRACLDWTERRDHLAGALAAAIAERLFGLGWIVRGAGRTVRVTDVGRDGLSGWLDLGWPPVEPAA